MRMRMPEHIASPGKQATNSKRGWLDGLADAKAGRVSHRVIPCYASAMARTPLPRTAHTATPRKPVSRRIQSGRGYLDGHFLIAMPGMLDDRFARSVVYICAHSSEGAMGITINRPAPQITFSELLVQLDIIPRSDQIRLPEPVQKMTVHKGGPVETGRGFVLHSADYYIENSTLPIDEHVSLTATLEILKAIAAGNGPASALLALGYAGWAPGQLETEIQANGWLNCPAAAEVIFDPDLEGKYTRALAMIGIDPSRLTAQAGHA
jgi:putative transcriptional regulator